MAFNASPRLGQNQGDGLMHCIDCNTEIPAARLEALPGVQHCLECSDNHTPIVKGYMIYSHKTAGEVIMATGAENIRRLKAEYERAR